MARRWGLLVLVALTIGCRAAYVVPTRIAQAEDPIRAAEVELSAISLVENGVLGNIYHEPTGPTAHVSPVYPFLLAGIYAVFEPYTLPAMLAQSLLAISLIAATLACLPWLARRIGLSESAGWLAAFALAVAPINFFYESFGDWEQPLAALVLLGILAGFLGLRQCVWESRRLIVGLGLLTGIAALLSPSLMPAVGLMILSELAWPTAPRKRILAGAVGIMALTALLVTPWIVRNYFALGGFVPLRSNFGLELAFGNHPGATGSSNIDWSIPGMSDMLRHPHPNARECQHLKEVGEIAYMKERQQEAMTWIAANPGRFAELTAARFRMFWFPGREMFNSSSLSTRIKIVCFGAISVLMFLTLIRLAIARNGAAGLLSAALFGASFVYLITHMEMRYRLPVHALSGLLAAEAVVAAFLWARQRWAPAKKPAEKTGTVVG